MIFLSILFTAFVGTHLFAAEETLKNEQAEVSSTANLKRELLSIMYLKTMFGHLHQNPSRYSASLTTLSCGHPIKVMRVRLPEGKEEVIVDGKWYMANVGPYEGFINTELLSEKQVTCFQDRYPRFFDSLDTEISDLFYWGRLYDQFIIGKSKVR